ncbi:MAG: hypothetical protein AAFP03_05830 [Cyanobacteria bacterium J06598_3]
MSDSATFEFETAVAIAEVSETISFLWDGSCCEANVYAESGAPGRTFCTLDYLFGTPEERPMLMSVLQYIHSISSDGKVYYYRCADFVGAVNNRSAHLPILEVSVDDLFTADYAPSLAASVETKYLVFLT